MSTRNSVMIVLGLMLVAAGLMLGLVPSTTSDGYVTVDCGSPWSPSREAAGMDAFMEGVGKAISTTGVVPDSSLTESCEDTLGSRGGWGVALSVLGALTLLGMGFLYVSQKQETSGDPVGPVERVAVDES